MFRPGALGSIKSNRLHPSNQSCLEATVDFTQTPVLKLPLQHWLQSISKNRQPFVGLFSVSARDLRSPKHLGLTLPCHVSLSLAIDAQGDYQAFYLSLV